MYKNVWKTSTLNTGNKFFNSWIIFKNDKINLLKKARLRQIIIQRNKTLISCRFLLCLYATVSEIFNNDIRFRFFVILSSNFLLYRLPDTLKFFKKNYYHLKKNKKIYKKELAVHSYPSIFTAWKIGLKIYLTFGITNFRISSTFIFCIILSKYYKSFRMNFLYKVCVDFIVYLFSDTFFMFLIAFWFLLPFLNSSV